MVKYHAQLTSAQLTDLESASGCARFRPCENEPRLGAINFMQLTVIMTKRAARYTERCETATITPIKALMSALVRLLGADSLCADWSCFAGRVGGGGGKIGVARDREA